MIMLRDQMKAVIDEADDQLRLLVLARLYERKVISSAQTPGRALRLAGAV